MSANEAASSVELIGWDEEVEWGGAAEEESRALLVEDRRRSAEEL
jgi:hypothetical protein